MDLHFHLAHFFDVYQAKVNGRKLCPIARRRHSGTYRLIANIDAKSGLPGQRGHDRTDLVRSRLGNLRRPRHGLVAVVPPADVGFAALFLKPNLVTVQRGAIRRER